MKKTMKIAALRSMERESDSNTEDESSAKKI